MLQAIPTALGRALRPVRAGIDRISAERPGFTAAAESVVLESPAFHSGEALPRRFTADGEGLSPPLTWHDLPADAAGLVLLVEDPDAPAPMPLLHLLAWDLPVERGGVLEGEFSGPPGEGLDQILGRNSYLRAGYLPPDPPPGHGPHRYLFQLFALDRRLHFDRPPGRNAVLRAMRRHVLGKGVLAGTYGRP